MAIRTKQWFLAGLSILAVSNCSAHVDVIIQTHIGAGFFAEFGKVIRNLIFYEHDGIRSVQVDWTNQFFPFKNDPNENGWDLYFEPIVLNRDPFDMSEPGCLVGNNDSHELHDQLCLSIWLNYDDYLPHRVFVHEKIKQYIRIKQDIQDQVDSFYEQHLKGNVCIGVHVRYALCHTEEMPDRKHPSLEAYCAEVDNLLNKHARSKVKIFLASDSHFVINYFREHYGKSVCYIDAYRAQNTEDPGVIYENPNYWINHPAEWERHKPGYKGGEGTLKDCLLLSKCDYLIHTTSNFATYASYFNPYIKSIYLPRDIPFWDCRYRGDKSVRNKFLNPN
jgi:hypothetical protein